MLLGIFKKVYINYKCKYYSPFSLFQNLILNLKIESFTFSFNCFSSLLHKIFQNIIYKILICNFFNLPTIYRVVQAIYYTLSVTYSILPVIYRNFLYFTSFIITL